MIYLIFLICTSSAMDDCQIQVLDKPFRSMRQCEHAADIYRAVLVGDNYLIQCERGERV